MGKARAAAGEAGKEATAPAALARAGAILARHDQAGVPVGVHKPSSVRQRQTSTASMPA